MLSTTPWVEAAKNKYKKKGGGTATACINAKEFADQLAAYKAKKDEIKKKHDEKKAAIKKKVCPEPD